MSTLTAPANGNVATQPKSASSKLRDMLKGEDFHKAVAEALPKHMTADRFVRTAITAMLRVPKLADCEQVSVLDCMFKLSQYGLEPDGRRAHLIPYKKRVKIDGQWQDQLICTLIIDYKGLSELVMRSGIVSYLHADLVRRGDIFDFSKGELRDHRPWFLRDPADRPKEPGEIFAVYSLVRMKDGTEKAEVLALSEVYSIRDNSEGWKAFKAGYAKASPWDPTNPVSEGEMMKKTAFRRLSKWLPLSPEIQEFIQSDDDVTGPGAAGGLIRVPEGPTFSDQLTNMMAAGSQADADQSHDDSDGNDNGNASGLDKSGEESQTRQPGDDGAPFDDANQTGAASENSGEAWSKEGFSFFEKFGNNAIKRTENANLMSDLMAAKSKLQPWEFEKLKAMAAENTARLTKK